MTNPDRQALFEQLARDFNLKANEKRLLEKLFREFNVPPETPLSD
ncbi:MAG: hypothetical protein ACU837_15550 [Gammaproteobacteria bacterium]